MRLRAVAAAGLLATWAPSVSAQRVSSDSTGALFGVVVMKEGRLPLSYSVVSIAALGRERFTNEAGAFSLIDLPAGPVKLRVRHLGYAPVDLTVTVWPRRIDTVRVELTRLAIRLDAVRVSALPECKNPGAPTGSADSSFAAVFDQLHQNADQYRLLADAYPFASRMERTMSRKLVSGDLRIEGTDTLTLTSGNAWRYQPGNVVGRGVGWSNRGSMVLNIPTIVHFADRTFLENHCFYNGGQEIVDGVELMRIDFNAAARIKQPDVDGIMYLDPSTFQIRRSVLRLSRIPREAPGLIATEVITLFAEALPSIPVIAAVSSVSSMERSNRPTAIAAAYEQHRLLSVGFLKGMPGDEPKKPPALHP